MSLISAAPHMLVKVNAQAKTLHGLQYVTQDGGVTYCGIRIAWPELRPQLFSGITCQNCLTRKAC